MSRVMTRAWILIHLFLSMMFFMKLVKLYKEICMQEDKVMSVNQPKNPCRERTQVVSFVLGQGSATTRKHAEW